MVLSVAADNRMMSTIQHIEEDQRGLGLPARRQVINHPDWPPRQHQVPGEAINLSAEALHSAEYSSISSTHKQNAHLNKLKSIYRSGNANNHSVSSQSRLSSNVVPFGG